MRGICCGTAPAPPSLAGPWIRPVTLNSLSRHWRLAWSHQNQERPAEPSAHAVEEPASRDWTTLSQIIRLSLNIV